MRIRYAAVMVTRKCNMSCRHCSVESNPHIKGQPSDEELRGLVDSLIDGGIDLIQFTGGEPLLRAKLVLELMERAKASGVSTTIVSNGFWGKKPARARETMKALLDAGLVRLALSYDRFHAEFQGPEPILNILDAAEEFGQSVHINITRSLDDSDLDDLVEPFRGRANTNLRFYDVQPVGLAKELEDELRGRLDGFCSACEQITFTDNGRAIACNGPAYFESPESGLFVGEYGPDSDISELLQRHKEDPILQTIRIDGPSRLRDILLGLPGYEDHPLQKNYSGMCGLCLALNRDAGAVKALREYLSRPEVVAERLARGLVLEAARKETFHRDAVNAREGPRAFAELLVSGPRQSMDRVFGRADLDWERLALILDQNGLLALLENDEQKLILREWAPTFFRVRVEEARERRDAEQVVLRERLAEVLRIGEEHGLGLKPFGASRLLQMENPRVESHLCVSSSRPVGEVKELLGERLEYPVFVVERQEQDLGEPERIALECLWQWRNRLYRRGGALAWDLCFLNSVESVDWSGLKQRGLDHELFFLREHLGLNFGIGARCRGSISFLVRFFNRIMAHQMFLDDRVRSNFWLAPVHALLHGLIKRSPVRAFTELLTFLKDCPRTLSRRGWRPLFEEVVADTKEVVEVALYLLRREGWRPVQTKVGQQ